MRTKKSILNIIVGVISLIITTVLGFALSKIFISNMGIEKNGLNSVFTNIMAILSISELGIAGAINYNLYKPILKQDYDRISIIMTFYKKCYRVIGLFILGLSIIMSFFVGGFIKDATVSHQYIMIAFLIFSFDTVITYFLAYARNLFYGFQQAFITSIIDFIVKIAKTILQIYLITHYQNYFLYLGVNVFFDLLSNVIIYIYSKKKYPEVSFHAKNRDKELEKMVFEDVKSLSVIQITNAVINFTDTIIISKFVGIIQTGLFANYKMIVTQLTNLINTIFNGLGASIGNLLAEDNRERIQVILIYLQYFCFFIGAICFMGVMIFTQLFITLWIGEEFLLSFIIVALIAINLYINIQRQVITYFLRTGGYHKKMVSLVIIEALLNFVISIILVFKWNIAGVLIGTVISSIFGYFANSILLYKIYNFNYLSYIFRQIKYLIYIAILYGCMYLTKPLFHFSTLLNFLLMLLTFGLIVGIGCFLIFIKEKDLKDLRRGIKLKLES